MGHWVCTKRSVRFSQTSVKQKTAPEPAGWDELAAQTGPARDTDSLAAALNWAGV